jgi:hypothetical protein
MRLCPSFTLLLVAFALTCAPASATRAPRDAMAEWLSQQFHRSIAPSQVLVAPAGGSLEGCAVTNMRIVPTGATSLRLLCPAYSLPQLVLLNLSSDSAALPHAAPQHTAVIAPTVRAGAVLQADWRTSALHATLPVVAIESGSTGGQIRVRVANTSRVMHARILSAHTVAILSVGA